eukprot:CAMPEP_0168317476 /NCGR_PEP_ID=MMETSP0210-20121227/25488_1 /TAXON_ID=40633 /ORGANISM="Condylostoma magnum, Strain COL2" /LENGTH=70 /DNA_ID=CAMNT_0008317089 /DNA_START=550 /DNA_END=766 /DNA_ORIENTATION=+
MNTTTGCIPKANRSSEANKKTVYGELFANVVSNPYFPGNEMHYLRAQIARITHGTTLIPVGQYKEVEEEP